ncbi:protein-disulfide reductase DsbD [Sulfurimonas sp.]|jgi:thiol:disulfide interchange protein DsbD|uniref:protein-disulfide reductase DsbD n=1 Tax=Sulfurimonas sp. TaxID=2022749 RepID=UPI0025D7B925|nr:protein-disulfide reductase DsbD [Sulfurimonas sp.]MBT5935934.1 protein-disulfide reductase DsbD [Sulfurimonas sp.]
MKYIANILMILLFINSLNAGDFLMPDEAFKPYAKMNEAGKIETGVVLGKNIYIYSKEMKFSLKSKEKYSIENIEYPEATVHNEETVYVGSPKFILTLSKKEDVLPQKEVVLLLSYQGCSEMGLCYEPFRKEFTVNIQNSELTSTKALTVKKEKKSTTDMIADTIRSGDVMIVLATFFGFGLLLAMTPCVFPMIPIISGLIISQGDGITTKKAFALSLVYVLSMAIAYTIAGVLAGLFGANLQAALQVPWVVYSFSFIFVALAFSMFGFYELKLPDAIVNRVSKSSNHSGYIGVAIMGFLSALIVGPCVAAPLAGALVYIGQTGDAVLGGMALFFMSLGMGIPLIVVGVSAGKFMPKPGAWMTMVNAVFGVLMLAVAIWMLEKILSADIVMILYSILGIGFALFLGVFRSGGHFFKHSVAMIIFIYSVSLFIGFLAGSSSMTKPLGFLNTMGHSSGVLSKEEKLSFEVIHSITELDKVLKASDGKKVLLDFSAAWCTSCKELEEMTFTDPDVMAKMKEFILVRADITENSSDEKELSKKYGVFGPPALIFFDENSAVMKDKTVIGFIEPKEFLEHLNSI